MANDLTDNPLFVDTAAVVRLGPCRVARFRWVGAGSANSLVVRDGTTDTSNKWEAVGNAANFTDDSGELCPPIMFTESINVTTIAAGRLYIYLAD